MLRHKPSMSQNLTMYMYHGWCVSPRQVVLAVDMRVDDLEHIIESFGLDPDSGVLYVLSPSAVEGDPYAVVAASVAHTPVSGHRTESGQILGACPAFVGS